MYLNYPMFLFFMMSGMLLTLNSSSWMTAWLGMELNILGFLPLLVNYQNSLSFEMVMKYFLISSVTSIIVLFFSFLIFSFWNYNSFMLNNIFISISLAMKLGCAPFHQWFITLAGNISPLTSFLLMTIQKLPPLFLFNMNFLFYYIIMFLLLSSTFGSIGGFFQLSTMKLMAYSSLSHLSWIFSSILFFNKIWLLYFIIYSIMLIPIFIFIYYLKFFHTNQTHNIQSFSAKFMLMFSILSFAGFPPLLGFFPKMMIIMMMFQMKIFFISMFLIMMSLINLYFYLRLSYNFLFISSYAAFKSNKYNKNFFLSIISFSPLIMIIML